MPSINPEGRAKTFDRLLSAPISLHSLVFGESLSGFLYSLGIACLPLAVGVIMFSTPIVNAPVLVIAMILTSFCFATLGTLFAAYPTENVGEVMSMLNTVRLPQASADIYLRNPDISYATNRSKDRPDIPSHLRKRYDRVCLYR